MSKPKELADITKDVGIVIDAIWKFAMLYTFLIGLSYILSMSGYEWVERVYEMTYTETITTEKLLCATNASLAALTNGLLMFYYVICDHKDSRKIIIEVVANFICFELMIRAVGTISFTPLVVAAALCLAYVIFSLVCAKKGENK